MTSGEGPTNPHARAEDGHGRNASPGLLFAAALGVLYIVAAVAALCDDWRLAAVIWALVATGWSYAYTFGR